MSTVENPVKPSPILHRKRGKVVVLLCVMYFIAYFDRTNIATAGPRIIEEFGLTKAEFGLTTSAFALAYLLLQIGGGRLGEKLGPRKALLILGLVWGAATLFTGLATGIVTLLIARALLGLAESATFPTATQAMSRWVPADRNGFVQGIVHSASRLGTAAAPIAVGALILVSGWRESFFVVGALSVLWAVAWYVFFRDKPSDEPGITRVELSEISGQAEAIIRPPVPWKRLAKQILPVTLVDFGYGWVAWMFFTWIPSLLANSYDLDLKAYAPLTSLILIGGVVGDTLGGVLSDRMYVRTGDAIRSRKTFLLIGFIGSAVCLLPILFGPPLPLAVGSLALSFFFLELTNAQLWSIPMDVAPTWSGTASGMMNSGFAVSGVVSAVIGGALIDWTAGYGWTFGVSVAILVGATILAARLNPKPVHPEPADRVAAS